MLFDRHSSVLVVIDAQDYFLGKLPLDWRKPLVERMTWLVDVARALNIPIVATAEDIARNGTLTKTLLEALPAATPIHNKMSFGLCADPLIRGAIEDTKAQHCVLVGLETDVCIAQSALGLLELGYRVAVIEDATGSPPPHHQSGLRRVAQAGCVVTTCKAIHYEWVRDLETLAKLKADLNKPPPAHLTL